MALAGFGLDSLIEIGASTVVIWELSGTGAERQRRGLRLIGYAFAALAVYLLAQPHSSFPWTISKPSLPTLSMVQAARGRLERPKTCPRNPAWS